MNSRAVIEPSFAEAISAGQVPAIAGAAARSDDAGSGAVGEAELGGRPVELTTPFRAYSVSKPFTALAVVSMHLEGRFGLDDSANHHLQSLEVLDPSGQPAAVPIRALLTHTAPLEPAVMTRVSRGVHVGSGTS